MRSSSLTIVVALLLAVSAEAAAQDLSGTWSYVTSGSWKKGPCPMGGEAKGKLKITVKGKTFTLVFESGRTCRPASMCTFAGTVKGRTYVGSNKAKVDSEGGTAANTLTITAKSPTSAAGTSSSSYTHPGGMRCTWGSKIALTKQR
jgi:hypothetical protein